MFALAWSAANAAGAILSGAIRARLGPEGFTVEHRHARRRIRARGPAHLAPLRDTSAERRRWRAHARCPRLARVTTAPARSGRRRDQGRPRARFKGARLARRRRRAGRRRACPAIRARRLRLDVALKLAKQARKATARDREGHTASAYASLRRSPRSKDLSGFVNVRLDEQWLAAQVDEIVRGRRRLRPRPRRSRENACRSSSSPRTRPDRSPSRMRAAARSATCSRRCSSSRRDSRARVLRRGHGDAVRHVRPLHRDPLPAAQRRGHRDPRRRISRRIREGHRRGDQSARRRQVDEAPARGAGEDVRARGRRRGSSARPSA